MRWRARSLPGLRNRLLITKPSTIRKAQVTKLSESTKRKQSLLQLAEELGNVSNSCKIMGYHRDTFYEVRRDFQVGGVSALVEKRLGPRKPHPNRVAPEIKQKILDYAMSFPTHAALRASNELRLVGTDVGPTGVRYVWQRHGCESRYKRLMRLKQHAQGDTVVLSEQQMRLLERQSLDLRYRRVKASRPERVLPLYDTLSVQVGAVFTDNGEISTRTNSFSRWRASSRCQRLRNHHPGCPAAREIQALHIKPDITSANTVC